MTNNKFNLTGKVAIVTGASRGIGFAIAEAFAKAGVKVVLSSRKLEALDQAAEKIQANGARPSRLLHIPATRKMSGGWWLPVLNVLGAWTFWLIMLLQIRISGRS